MNPLDTVSRRTLIQGSAGFAAALAHTSPMTTPPTYAAETGDSGVERELIHPTDHRGIIADPFRAGRSMTMSQRGIVASSQVLASQAGLDMLRSGGTAMDAAVAAAAVLNVVEPMSTGIGGDAFFLYYEASTGKVHGLNGSGRSPKALKRAHFADKGLDAIPARSWLSVTVPGALDAFAAGLERFGRKALADVFEPAITYALDGFPVTERIARSWEVDGQDLLNHTISRRIYMPSGRAPVAGQVFRNPDLARTFREVGKEGRDFFYRGPIARKIAEYAQQTGGYISAEDFASHHSQWVDPISTNYRGYDVHQIPPNGQGIGVLIMLNILEGFDLKSMGLQTAPYLHTLIEAKKLAYADLYHFVADPDFRNIPIDRLLDKAYAAERRKRIDPDRAATDVTPGLNVGTDTVYLTAIDREGNACSFINSLFWNFGSAITAADTGIILQSRGAGFTLEKGHFNEYAPGRRPYHTIIPGMVTRGGKLYLSYGLMGGAMQPQGHVQFLTNHIDHGDTIQEANDRPRWHHTQGPEVLIEHGHPAEAVRGLSHLGHQTTPEAASSFGGCQAVLVHLDTDVFMGASDPRKDGAALGY